MVQERAAREPVGPQPGDGFIGRQDVKAGRIDPQIEARERLQRIGDVEIHVDGVAVLQVVLDPLGQIIRRRNRLAAQTAEGVSQ